jgi:hypothetical protein
MKVMCSFRSMRRTMLLIECYLYCMACQVIMIGEGFVMAR